jgi:group I intron endonuclease
MKKEYELYNSGIYTITNVVNGKMIVGKASNFTKRKNWHLKVLNKGSHPNTYLQNAVNKHGLENFKFEILEECEQALLSSLEHYWATLLDTHNRNFGYNLQPTDPNGRITHSEETRQKMRIANTGRKWTEQQRKRYSSTRKSIGWKPSDKMIENTIQACSKPILQIDNTGKIAEWGSITQAVNSLGFGKKYIRLCCQGKQELYKNCSWKYKNAA